MTERDVFVAALQIAGPTDRAGYLDRAAPSDPALRERVAELLGALDRAGRFLEAPADSSGVRDLPAAVTAAEAPGATVGPYTLREAVGEGGMGTVYLAEQSHPVKRQVALKVIKPGMDSRQVVARFEAERQALALMDHPNIARVLDAGATESGRPYFVMELVRGLPVTDYCDQARLPVADRLRLFADVCRAVQHAHQKGVVHRDLKPSNVLVTVVDGKPVPKVIDFGIAKATGAALTNRSLYTGFHQLVGTPLYMSPEQAELSGVDVDTRSDVYSLGVLLYELLTGTTPFDPEALRTAGLDEVRRMIREDDPPRPSRRLSTLAAARSATTPGRPAVDPRRLGRLMRTELDWVVMKCLAKDRAGRYQTAAELAADVDRHLAGEPVEAAPPTPWYRLRKFARRHRAGVAAAAAAAVAALLGLAGLAASTVLIARERNDKAAALEAAERNAARAEEQRGVAEAQEARAKAGEALARRNTYAAHINLAHHAWTAGDVRRARELIDGLVPRPGREDLRGFEWHYLARLCRAHRLSLDGHRGPVYCVAFSPDGKTLATAGADGAVRLWATGTGHEMAVLVGHRGTVGALAFAPDGRTLASGGADRTAVVWDLAARAPRRTYEGFPESVNCVAYSPDGRTLATGTAAVAGGVGSPYSRFRPHSKAGELKLWAADGGAAPVTLCDAPSGVLAVAFSPDGKRLAAATGGGVQIWDPARGPGQAPSAVTGVRAPTLSLAFAAGGGVLVAGTWDGRVVAWDLTDRQVAASWQAHSGPVTSLAVGPGGERVATGGTDQRAKVWDASTGRECATFRGHSGPVWGVALAPDGATLATASWDGTVKLWPPDRPQDRDSITAESYSLAFSPDGRSLACAGREVEVWDAWALRPIGRLPGFADANTQVAFAPDGKTLATAGTDPRVRLWDVGTWKCRAVLPGHRAKVWALAFAPDGKTLASGAGQYDKPGEVRLWDVPGNAPRAAWAADTFGAQQLFTVRAVAFAPDGRTLAASCAFGGAARDAVELRDPETGRSRGTLRGERHLAEWVAYAPDGRTIATGEPDRTVRLWDADGGATAVLKGHTDKVYHGAFSPDGKTLATGGWDGTVRLWHVATGQELMTLSATGGVVWSVAFAPDGRTLAAGSAEGPGVAVYRADLADGPTPPPG